MRNKETYSWEKDLHFALWGSYTALLTAFIVAFSCQNRDQKPTVNPDLASTTPTSVPTEMIQGDMPREFTQGVDSGLITASWRCSDSHSPYGQPNYILPPHIDIDIQMQGINSRPEGIWTTMEDLNIGRRWVVSFVGEDGIPTGFSLHGYVNSLRRTENSGNRVYSRVYIGDPDFIRPNTEYSIVTYRNAYTEGQPRLDNPVTFTTFRTGDCVVPDWAK